MAASSGRGRIAPRASAALTTAPTQRRVRPRTAPPLQLRVRTVNGPRAPTVIEARAPTAIGARARRVIEARARTVTADRGPSDVTIGEASVVMTIAATTAVTTVAMTAPRR